MASKAGPDLCDVLRRDIALFRFKPGERLAEEPLSEHYGVSRTPIREALQRLEAEGLVESVGNRRVVRRLDVAELEDIFRVRTSLERLAAIQACARASDAGIEALGATWDTSDDGEYFEADLRFHLGVADLAANPFLTSSLERANDRIAIVRMVDFSTPERIAITRSEHVAILDAIGARDAARAERLMQDHIEAAMSNVRELIVRALAQIYLDGD